MDTNRKIKILMECGVLQSVAREAIFKIEHEEETRKNKKFDRDFEKILVPLSQQIKSLCSSRTQWIKEPVRAEVYSAYLELCRKAKKKIKAAAREAMLKNQTISECAAERGITEFQGRRWSAWVPNAIRIRFILEFEKLPPGRRIVPFIAAMERSKDDKCWDRITTKIIALQAQHAPDSQIQMYLQTALTAANGRTTTARAPVTWAHLLPTAMRKDYNQWSKRTLGGLRAGLKTEQENDGEQI